MKTIFKIKSGRVYGKYWGGGEGAYSMNTDAFKKEFTTFTELQKYLDDNYEQLDGGMGYEEILGCIAEVHEISTIEQDEKTFVCNDYYSTTTAGNLSNEQEEFLLTL